MYADDKVQVTQVDTLDTVKTILNLDLNNLLN